MIIYKMIYIDISQIIVSVFIYVLFITSFLFISFFSFSNLLSFPLHPPTPLDFPTLVYFCFCFVLWVMGSTFRLLVEQYHSAQIHWCGKHGMYNQCMHCDVNLWRATLLTQTLLQTALRYLASLQCQLCCIFLYLFIGFTPANIYLNFQADRRHL